jgi:hypothetical protein
LHFPAGWSNLPVSLRVSLPHADAEHEPAIPFLSLALRGTLKALVAGPRLNHFALNPSQ